MLGGALWDDNSRVTSEIWMDEMGRPVLLNDPRAAAVKYHVGDVITESDKSRLLTGYWSETPGGQQSPSGL